MRVLLPTDPKIFRQIWHHKPSPGLEAAWCPLATPVLPQKTHELLSKAVLFKHKTGYDDLCVHLNPPLPVRTLIR